MKHFQGHIGWKSQDYIRMTPKCDKKLRKPKCLEDVFDHLQFDFQVEGEKISFDLSYHQCAQLVEEISRFMKIYEYAYTAYYQECKKT